MTKKGILQQETVKIIIAVVSIVILVYLATGLYKITQKTKEKEQALNILTQVVNKINSFKADSEMTLAGPQKWYMYAPTPENICVSKCNTFSSELLCTDEDIDTRRCSPIKSNFKIEVQGGQILIYIIDIKFEQQNDKIIISKK